MTKDSLVRIIPFAVFMLFIGIEQGTRWLIEQGHLPFTDQTVLYMYPVKAVVVAGLLIWFWKHYIEINLTDFKQLPQTIGSILLGLLVFVLWINMDWDFATIGDNPGFNPLLIDDEATRIVMIGFRLMGAALVVPIMEEIFWRSFVLRYIISADFMKVRIGTYTLSSFLIGAALFGLEHHLILAGVMAGMAYSLLLYWTRSISQCILAHAVTNLVLGIYVLQAQQWQFW